MPLDFLWGDEDFLIENAIKKIKNEVLKGDVNELNYRVVDNPSFALFSETLRTNAMMFGSVVVVIKCSKYFLESNSKQKLDEKQTAELISALNNLSDRVHFVLVCQTPRGEKKKPDSRKKLYKEILKLTKPQEFPSYRNYEEYKLIPIVKKMACEIGLKINQSESSLLIQMTGASLRDLHNNLEKLKLYAHPENNITSKMIEKVLSDNLDIFSITDLIIKKDYANALSKLAEILQKEHFLPSLAFLQTSVSNLFKTKLYSSKLSNFEIAAKLNQHEFVVKKNIEKLSAISLEELLRVKLNLSNVEFNLKTGAVKDPICAYQLAFLEFCYE